MLSGVISNDTLSLDLKISRVIVVNAVNAQLVRDLFAIAKILVWLCLAEKVTVEK